MVMVSPVAGLRPWRSPRCLVENVPKPGIVDSFDEAPQLAQRAIGDERDHAIPGHHLQNLPLLEVEFLADLFRDHNLVLR